MLLSFLLLTACGGSSNPDQVAVPSETHTAIVTKAPTMTSTPTEVVVSGTITIWHSWEEPYVPALMKTITAFQEEYPNVHFDVLYVPELDLRASFEQAALEGGGPTVLIGSDEWGPSFYDLGLIAGISELIDPDLLNTLNSAAVGRGRYQDELIGLPLDINGVVLYRNTGIIPQSPFTYDELISLAKSANQGDILGAYLDRSFYFSGAHLLGLGGDLMTAEGEPAFDDEIGLRWVNLLLSFDQAGPTDFFTDNDVFAFKEGRVGFLVEGTRRRNELKVAIGETNLVIDPWPIHADGHLSGFVLAENIFLSLRALDEDNMISWKFVEFFMSPGAQSEIAEVGLIPAISGSPVNVATGKVNIPDPIIKQAMIALIDGKAYPLSPEVSLYRDHIDRVLKMVFEAGESPTAALRSASEAIKEALTVLDATQTPVP
ncbi:MAG: extracellular solute-binding protein [Anaerolineales bacterium]|nr:extracellular solute-binding protein [Anaerolineales bacterium]